MFLWRRRPKPTAPDSKQPGMFTRRDVNRFECGRNIQALVETGCRAIPHHTDGMPFARARPGVIVAQQPGALQRDTSCFAVRSSSSGKWRARCKVTSRLIMGCRGRCDTVVRIVHRSGCLRSPNTLLLGKAVVPEAVRGNITLVLSVLAGEHRQLCLPRRLRETQYGCFRPVVRQASESNLCGLVKAHGSASFLECRSFRRCSLSLWGKARLQKYC
jgi:hypothetical protein